MPIVIGFSTAPPISMVHGRTLSAAAVSAGSPLPVPNS